VILFGAIPAIILVIPVIPAEVPIVPVDPLVALEVGVVSVTSLTGVLDLVDYSSSSDSDPSEDSLPLAPELPLVSPFLCSDDSEADSESEPAEQRPERHESLVVHDVMVSRWRDRVASMPSSPSGSSSHDTLASSSEFPIALIRPCEAIPFGRPYRTHPNRPRRLLTTRKRVGHFPARRLAWRRVSHRSSNRHSSPDFTSDSTSSGSPSDSLSNTSSVHSSGFDASGQTHSGASTRVASSRCKSPTTSVSSSTPVLRSIAPTHADLLPPCKRFRDSYSPENSREEHMDIVNIAASDIREDEEEFETAQRQLEASQLMASGERAGLTDRIRRLGRENLRVRALLCIERDRVDSLRHHMALLQEEFRQIRRDRDDARRRLRILESFVERRLGFRP
ncbi:hypothetical protein Tco_1358579, partial [Tanacetum coccineum]